MKKAHLLFLGFLLTSIFGLSFASSAISVRAAEPLEYTYLVTCDGVPAQKYDKDGNAIGPRPGEEKRQIRCDIVQLFKTIQSVITFMFKLTIPVAVIMFTYGGFLYLTGVEKHVSKAKGIFTNVAVGFIIMLVAWVVVYTLVEWLVHPDSSALIFLKNY